MDTPTAHSAGAPSAGDGTRQFLTFTIADDPYGVEILRVQEIKGYEQATPLPNAPPWFLGVLNLRGTVVPVVDLRLRLGLDPRPCTPLTVIVILNAQPRVIGLVVDAVSDVVDVPAGVIEPLPALGAARDPMIAGIARRESELLLLLDVERLVESSTLVAGCDVAH